MLEPAKSYDLEWTVQEFLEERSQALGWESEVENLRSQADMLRLYILAFRAMLLFLAGIAAKACILGIGGLSIWLLRFQQSALPVRIVLLLFLGVALIAIVSRADRFWRFRTWLTFDRQFDLVMSDSFAEAFAPVVEGDLSLATLSPQKDMATLAPVSRKAISTLASERSLHDRFLPAIIVPASDLMLARFASVLTGLPKEMAILGRTGQEGEAGGVWHSYPLWQVPVPEIESIFDAVEIYPNDRVRNRKSRIAVLNTASYVQECATRSAKPIKSKLIKRIRLALAEASLRVEADETWTMLEAGQLRRLNMGDGDNQKKPESWLGELTRGKYVAVLGPIEAEYRRRGGDLLLMQRK